MDLKIRITGGGDKWFIARALHDLAQQIKTTPESTLEEGVQWEDHVLMTEISANNDINEDDE